MVHPRAARADAAAGAGGGAGQSERPQGRPAFVRRLKRAAASCSSCRPTRPTSRPIEQAFSKIKAILRGLGARTKEALQEAVRLAIEAITPTMRPPGSPTPGTLCLLKLPESCSKPPMQHRLVPPPQRPGYWSRPVIRGAGRSRVVAAQNQRVRLLEVISRFSDRLQKATSHDPSGQVALRR